MFDGIVGEGLIAAEHDPETEAEGKNIGALVNGPAALIVIGGPIVAVLFQRGEFSAADTQATAATLGAYASGLPAYVLVRVLAPGFFARDDTVTPMRIAAVRPQ